MRVIREMMAVVSEAWTEPPRTPLPHERWDRWATMHPGTDEWNAWETARRDAQDQRFDRVMRIGSLLGLGASLGVILVILIYAPRR